MQKSITFTYAFAQHHPSGKRGKRGKGKRGTKGKDKGHAYERRGMHELGQESISVQKCGDGLGMPISKQ